jgi:hypothetical protein
VRALYLVDWLESNHTSYDEERLVWDPQYARQAVLQEWLREKGYDPDQIISFSLEAHPIGLPGAVSVGDDGLQRWRFA